jgi:2',3'-cyclic-nucleotide 2'-phosphodiesterase (5'-nucleotidase family)
MRANLWRVAAVGTVLGAFGAPLTHAEDRWRERDDDLQLTILQTTDLHDHANGADHVGLDVDPLTGRGGTGSYARIAAYVNYVRATTRHPVVLVDSGDWTMGTLYDLTLGNEPLALEFIELMRYDCVTLGNHEFDYTTKGLAQTLGAAEKSFGFHTPIVASNLNLNGDANLAPFFGPGAAIQSTRVQRLPNGLKVGYIGLMGQSAALDAPGSAPVTFTPLSAGYPAIQALVNQLRSVQGVQVVIALDHVGTDASGNSGEDVDLARHVSGIDVIASGHTHTPLAAAHTVANGSWNTQIIDAGAYGTNVSRIDLTYHRSTGATALVSSSNVAMTDAGLAALHGGLRPDFLTTLIVRSVDQQLNRELAPFFKQTFPDYDSARIATGIYHRVGVASQNMVSNAADLPPAPDGLGDLAADAVRGVPNSIIAQTLAAVGGNPANFPGYDFTPVQVGAVASGVLRSKLLAGVPLSFADVYDVLPLGISPDSSQALPVGYPLVSVYLSVADLKKVCALQLLAQTGLASGDFYLNLSGIQYSLNPAGSYAYFKYATAAAVLQLTSEKASGGSAQALQALGALASLGSDNGTALLAAYAGGNAYATAMVSLNDSAPDLPHIVVNLGALGQVAGAAATGAAAVSALVVSKAVAAIDTVSGFSPSDAANLGAVTPLADGSRVRASVDLFAVLLLGAVQAQFGVTITPYQAATGSVVFSGADIAGILGNRIDAAPATGGVQELKEWMALLSYEATGLAGTVGAEYSSTSNFTQFDAFGAAVQVRNASYPLANIGQLAGTLSTLQGAP